MPDNSAPHPDYPNRILFGAYRAEWLGELLFDLFTEPPYARDLTTSRPCFLIGGRGTGKTTILRGLSYEGQFALSKNQSAQIELWQFYGLYYRVDTNRVRAFTGDEVTEAQWTRLFAHYINLVVCDLLLRFLDWYEQSTGRPVTLEPQHCQRVAVSLNLGDIDSRYALATAIDLSVIAFEAAINNVADGRFPSLSMQGAPIALLMDAIGANTLFKQKNFFLLLDEYENFLEYQQRVLNTLIKHATARLTYKVGVKELGWRVRTTLNSQEQLVHPADYVRVDISEYLQGSIFEAFAEAVCEERLSRMEAQDAQILTGIDELLPGVTEDEEANRLGVLDAVHDAREYLLQASPATDAALVRNLDPLMLYLLLMWPVDQGDRLLTNIADYKRRPAEWNTRYGNYKYALLFGLRRGKRGIRKYYAGWSTFLHLSAGNIRYVLELVDQSILQHWSGQRTLSQPISVEDQTLAAQSVGRTQLKELEGLDVHGAKLTKLVLGLGRIFGVMAAEPEKHAPEINQFYLPPPSGSNDLWAELTGTAARDVDDLLRAGIMHLALLRSIGSKPVDESDTREYDYLLHPIFAPFFVFSWRRKRKMMITPRQLRGLVESPRATIREILGQVGRSDEAELPEQLSFFRSFYAGDSGLPAAE
ncbi:MAG TPA: hypothetical protein VII06_10320 [Chloroflexota bacterium]|jgi:hypothetical protein